jgi:outer membrane protein assembly factor BamB
MVMTTSTRGRGRFIRIVVMLTLLALSLGNGSGLAQGSNTSKVAGQKQLQRKMPAGLKPTPFTTKDGYSGWTVSIPGQHTLATPAVYADKLYLGGGFGSYEFYALSSRTGLPAWTFKTKDDGPTAAVVAEGCVAYNTESCIVYVHDARSGKLLWHKWLGDPLMSQPAIQHDVLYIAFPGRDGSHHLGAFRLRSGQLVWDVRISGELISAPVLEADNLVCACVDGSLYRFNARTGHRYWHKAYRVTAAPRISGQQIFISQRAERRIEISSDNNHLQQAVEVIEGFNLVDLNTGALRHASPVAPLPAPYLLTLHHQQEAYHANQAVSASGQKHYRAMLKTGKQHLSKIKGPQASQAEALQKRINAFEQIKPAETPEAQMADADMALALADELDELFQAAQVPTEQMHKSVTETKQTASHTKHAALTVQKLKTSMAAKQKEVQKAQSADSAVGFVQAPPAAKMQQAAENLGQSNVQSVWAYQGARPCLVGELTVMVHGDIIRALNYISGQVVWEKTIEGAGDATRPITPPALAGGKLYFGTADGRILCMMPQNGQLLWQTRVGGHFIFEPSVADGNIFLTTADGRLICLQTPDTTATGWAMWGGSAGHNGGFVTD